LLRCHANANRSAQTIVDALGLKMPDLFPPNQNRQVPNV
jgi:hypothetical protein